MFAHEVD